MLGPEGVAQPDAQRRSAAVVASHLGAHFERLGDRMLDGQRPQGPVAARDAVARRSEGRLDQPVAAGLKRCLDRDEVLAAAPGPAAAAALAGDTVRQCPADAIDVARAQ